MKPSYAFPKGPKHSPLRQFIQLLLAPVSLFTQCRQRYGRIFTLKLIGQKPRVVVSSTEDLKQVFSDTSNGKLSTGDINATLLQVLLGDASLLTLDDQAHLKHRKLLLPSFNGERMHLYAETIQSTVKKKIKTWQVGDALTLLNEFFDITFQVISTAIFGLDEQSANHSKLKEALRAMLTISTKPTSIMTLLYPSLRHHFLGLTPWDKICKAKTIVDQFIYSEIKARRKMDLTERTDILSLLIQAKDDSGNAFSDKDIRDEMMTLLIAGHDTTGDALAWTQYYLLANKSAMEMLKTELNESVTQDKDLPTNLNTLPYLDAVIKETLRMASLTPFIVHRAGEDYVIGEYTLPAGTIISPCLYLVHHDEVYWPNPETFNPERFLNTTPKPFTYIPFGKGVRRCIGAAFAQYQMKIVISELVKHVEFSLPPNYCARKKRLGVNLFPSKGVPVKIKRIHLDG